MGRIQKRFIIATVLVLVVVSSLLAYTTTYTYAGSQTGQQSVGVKNVIFLIGDGMGLSHIRLTQLAYGRLAMEEFTDIGIVYTDSLSGEVPDSAAAGTALSTGVKTWNNVVAMVPVNGKLVSVMTLLELAQKLGKSTGLVTTTRITHATPAVFASHVPHRNQETEIARQYIEHGVDVLMGGGAKYFTKDLLEEARRKGYTIVYDRAQLEKLDTDKVQKILGLFAETHIPYVLDRNESIPSLVDMFIAAVKVLEKNPNGFFLMVEGGRIDHASHNNDAPSVVAETKEFDDVVRLALEYAIARGDTLVIVAGDHETGGLAVGGYVYGRAVNFTLLLGAKASAARMAEEIKAGKDPKTVIQTYTSINITDSEAQEIKANPAPAKIGNIVSKYMGVAWASLVHTGQPVVVYAYGPGSQYFRGTLHETDIAKIIAALMLFGTAKPATVVQVLDATIPGDVNGDGKVGPEDAYIVLMLLLGREADNRLLRHVDINGNGVVDLEDVYLIYTGQINSKLPLITVRSR